MTVSSLQYNSISWDPNRFQSFLLTVCLLALPINHCSEVYEMPPRQQQSMQVSGIQNLSVAGRKVVWLSCGPPAIHQGDTDPDVAFFVGSGESRRVPVQSFPDKYLFVKPPAAGIEISAARYYLGIRNFSTADTGISHCVVIDTRTAEYRWIDPTAYHLLQGGLEIAPASVPTNRTLLVRQSVNAAIICPDATSSVKFESIGKEHSSSYTNLTANPRVRWNSDFAVLFIDHVMPEDAGLYICQPGLPNSPGMRQSTIEETVSATHLRLQPSTTPISASLSPCPLPSIHESTAQQQSRQPRHSKRPRTKRQSVLVANDQLLTSSLLRINENNNVLVPTQSLPNGTSPQSALPYRSPVDTVLPLPSVKRQRQLPQRLPHKIGRLSAPNVSSIGDNLAVNISWPPVKTADFYRVQMRTRLSSEKRWSKAIQLEETVIECCGQTSSPPSSVSECCYLPTRRMYLTNRQPAGLEPGGIYQFNVQALRYSPTFDTSSRSEAAVRPDQSFGGPIAIPLVHTHWSKPVSFEYISKVAPVITEAKRLADGAILLKWTLTKSAVGFPIDHFLLLYRAEERLDNGRLVYQGFRSVVVPGRETTEYKLKGLDHEKGYQIVVYGVNVPQSLGLKPEATIFTGGQNGRRITMFSHEIFVNPTSKPIELSVTGNSKVGGADGEGSSDGGTRKHQPPDSKEVAYTTQNDIDSNRLMFIILGALAGMMLLIMIFLVVLCICRQQREGQLRNGSLPMDHRQKRVKSAFMRSEKNVPNSSGRFILDELTARDQPEDLTKEAQPQFYSRHPSLLRHCNSQQQQREQQPYHLTYPPPVNPAPLPPEHMALISQSEAFQMIDRAASRSQSIIGANMIGPGVAVNPIGQPDVMVTLPAYHTTGGNHVNTRFLPPYDMKREPPSGGSVHEETDNEHGSGNVRPSNTFVCRNSNDIAPYSHHMQSSYGPVGLPGAYRVQPGVTPGHVDMPPPQMGVTNGIYYPPSSDSLATACVGLPNGMLVYPASQFVNQEPVGIISYDQQQQQSSSSVWVQPGPSSALYAGHYYNPEQHTPGMQNEAALHHRPQSVNTNGTSCRPDVRDFQDGMHDKPSNRPPRHRSVPPPMGSRGLLSNNSPSPATIGQQSQQSTNDERDCQLDEAAELTNGFQHQPLMSSSPRASILAIDDPDQPMGRVPYSTHNHANYGPPIDDHMGYRSPPHVDCSDMNHMMMKSAPVDQAASLGVIPRQYEHRSPGSYWVTSPPGVTNAYALVCQGYPLSPPIPAHRVGSAANPLIYGQCNPAILIEQQQQQSLCQGVPQVRDYSEYGIPTVCVATAHRQQTTVTSPPPPYANHSHSAEATYPHPLPPLPFHASRIARA